MITARGLFQRMEKDGRIGRDAEQVCSSLLASLPRHVYYVGIGLEWFRPHTHSVPLPAISHGPADLIDLL